MHFEGISTGAYALNVGHLRSSSFKDASRMSSSAHRSNGVESAHNRPSTLDAVFIWITLVLWRLAYKSTYMLFSFRSLGTHLHDWHPQSEQMFLHLDVSRVHFVIRKFSNKDVPHYDVPVTVKYSILDTAYLAMFLFGYEGSHWWGSLYQSLIGPFKNADSRMPFKVVVWAPQSHPKTKSQQNKPREMVLTCKLFGELHSEAGWNVRWLHICGLLLNTVPGTLPDQTKDGVISLAIVNQKDWSFQVSGLKLRWKSY